jgi:RHS repeat-associated protein
MKHILYILLLLLATASSVHADTSIINIYDANGNLVTGDGRYYEYNDANQLVKVRQGDTITGPVIAEYFYDFSGQRVKKIENGVVTYYVGKHFEKQVGGANEGSTSYYFGDDSERVAKKDPAGNIFYYHLDHLDGINAVTDSAGTVVAKTDYLPFGDVRAGSSGSEKYSYTGKEKDKTDLYYFEARYNSPEFRHFTQADIAEPDYDDPQDLNRYSYVGNNPLSYVDYDGFKKKKKAKLSKRERRAVALGLDPDKNKKWVGKLSEREFRSLTLGLDADKHKKKVGKMSNKEYKVALAKHNMTVKSMKTTASGSSDSLASVGSVQGSISSSVSTGDKGTLDEDTYCKIPATSKKRTIEGVSEIIVGGVGMYAGAATILAAGCATIAACPVAAAVSGGIIIIGGGLSIIQGIGDLRNTDTPVIDNMSNDFESISNSGAL